MSTKVDTFVWGDQTDRAPVEQIQQTASTATVDSRCSRTALDQGPIGEGPTRAEGRQNHEQC